MKVSSLIVFTLLFYAFHIAFLYLKDDAGLKMTFLDVGQGDSILITTPNNKNILVDGGWSFDADEKIGDSINPLACFIDLVVVTHSDFDHLGGVSRILKRCKAKEIRFNDVACSSDSCRSFVNNNEIKNIFAGDIYSFKPLTIHVLWPTKEYTNGGYNDSNDSSVVLLLDYGKFEAILTGDASTKVLNKIDIDRYLPLIQGKLDVFKSSHHGSADGLSRGLLKKLNPRYCVISVGEDNKYGHPTEEVIQFYDDINCEVQRTDPSGNIVFKVTNDTESN